MYTCPINIDRKEFDLKQINIFGMPTQHEKVAQKLAEACKVAAGEAIKATEESGQAKHVHHKNRKFSSRKEAMDAKIAAAKAKRENKGT